MPSWTGRRLSRLASARLSPRSSSSRTMRYGTAGIFPPCSFLSIAIALFLPAYHSRRVAGLFDRGNELGRLDLRRVIRHLEFVAVEPHLYLLNACELFQSPFDRFRSAHSDGNTTSFVQAAKPIATEATCAAL